MVIEVCGTPYEQGFVHGKNSASLIRWNVMTVKNTVEKSRISWESYNRYLDKNKSYLEANHAELLEELHGIADGASVSYEDIVLINIQLYFMADKLPSECTTMIARGSATLDGKTFVVKNRDMRGEYKHVILRRRYPDGVICTEVHVAGTITYPGSGMNSFGLAVSSTGMWSPHHPLDISLIEQSELQVNMTTILHECKTADDVEKFLNKTKRMIRLNLFAVDKTKALLLEVIDDDYVAIQDDNGILVRTNHFLSDKLKHYSPTPEEYPSTYARYERSTSFLKEHHGKIRFQDMLQIASDHENGGNCICRHGGAAGSITSYSSICVLEDNQLWTSLRNPCESLVLAQI